MIRSLSPAEQSGLALPASLHGVIYSRRWRKLGKPAYCNRQKEPAGREHTIPSLNIQQQYSQSHIQACHLDLPVKDTIDVLVSLNIHLRVIRSAAKNLQKNMQLSISCFLPVFLFLVNKNDRSLSSVSLHKLQSFTAFNEAANKHSFYWKSFKL